MKNIFPDNFVFSFVASDRDRDSYWQARGAECLQKHCKKWNGK